MPFFQGLAQNFLRGGAIEEMILRGPAGEHIGIVEHVQIGRTAGRILRRGGIHIDHAGLGLFHTVELTTDLVVADEFHTNFALSPLLQIAGKFQNAGAFD